MTIKEAVLEFDDWSYPWRFSEDLREKLKENTDQLALAERIIRESNARDNWMQGDLVLGCKITQSELMKQFPEIEDEVLACFVRAASYNWR